MDTQVCVICIICYVIAAVCAVLGGFQWAEKGVLLNNAYLYASAEERATMDKRPHYRQTAVVLWCIAASFLATGLSFPLQAPWLMFFSYGFLGVAVAFAVVSGIVIARKK